MISGLYLVLSRGQLIPLGGNILVSSGIGPITLRDTYILGLSNVKELPISFWMSLTILSIVSGGILLAYLFSKGHHLLTHFRGNKLNKDEVIPLFLILGCLFYCLPIFVIGYYDRYLMPLLVPLSLLILAPTKSTSAKRSPTYIFLLILLILPYFFFSIAGTKDYLAWNRVRWSALRTLLSTKAVAPSDIDGGLEFNGWYLYDREYKPKKFKSWWWVDNDEYIVSMGPIVGYKLFRKYQFSKWLPPGKEHLFVLRRNGTR